MKKFPPIIVLACFIWLVCAGLTAYAILELKTPWVLLFMLVPALIGFSYKDGGTDDKSEK